MKILGIDLGGTQIKYGIVENGSVLESAKCDTPSGGSYSETLDKIIEISRNMLKSHQDIGHIGLAAPGIIDTSAGIIRYSNNLGWHEIPICADIQQAIGKKVKIANDAQCATLGEALYGAGKGYSRVAMFTIGTGVGGGFIRDGKLETDSYGSMAYIFGHSIIEFDGKLCNCGRRGCLETYASASAIAKRWARTDQDGITVKEIFELARTGDTLANEIVREFLEYLSAGAVNIANILRPHVIIIGGGVSASADLIVPVVNKAMQMNVYGFAFAQVKVVQAELGNIAGIVGAASI